MILLNSVSQGLNFQQQKLYSCCQKYSNYLVNILQETPAVLSSTLCQKDSFPVRGHELQNNYHGASERVGIKNISKAMLWLFFLLEFDILFIFTVLSRQPSTKFYGLKKTRICRFFSLKLSPQEIIANYGHQSKSLPTQRKQK